jgi:hypothetical protein
MFVFSVKLRNGDIQQIHFFQHTGAYQLAVDWVRTHITAIDRSEGEGCKHEACIARSIAVAIEQQRGGSRSAQELELLT